MEMGRILSAEDADRFFTVTEESPVAIIDDIAETVRYRKGKRWGLFFYSEEVPYGEILESISGQNRGPGIR